MEQLELALAQEASKIEMLVASHQRDMEDAKKARLALEKKVPTP